MRVFVRVGVRLAVNVCVGVGPPANVAVYVVLLTGVVMSWMRAPPSDQDWKTLPPWGEGASMLRIMPSTPTTVDGAVNGWPSSFNWSPAGLVVNVIVVVRGTTSRKLSAVRPAESMTERWIRYQTLGDVSPTGGTTKDPPVDPLVGGSTGWVCVS